MKRNSSILIFFALLPCFLVGQHLENGQKRWSSQDKLKAEDFKIKIADNNNDAVFSQFMIGHSISGFDFMNRNLNQKIDNIFLGNASWIDTLHISSVEKALNYQQLQFNLAEVYARKFRKRVFESKREIAKGFDIVNKINDAIMTEFSEERAKLVEETEAGRNTEKWSEWEEKIIFQLEALDEFRFDNTKKIKLSE